MCKEPLSDRRRHTKSGEVLIQRGVCSWFWQRFRDCSWTCRCEAENQGVKVTTSPECI